MGEPQWSIERKLLIATFVLSVLSTVFGLGVNWARFTQQDSDIRALKTFNETELPATYIRRDVYSAEQARLTEAIDRLSRAIERGAVVR